jgi:translation initiation factor 3 subunit A
MPVYFYKPETAINRAQQFLEVNKDDAALETLLEVLRSKKHRSEVQKLKEVIKETLTLCIKLQQSTTVKDSLYQFRNITSNVEPSAFNGAVEHFLNESEECAKKARAESQQAVLDTVEDLDQLMTPESLLLSTVSGEDTQSRTDRALLTPWLKFLWESYRNILDLVRNNKTFEDLYRDIARRTFEFCLEYRRHTEFRKLCEMFRSHLLAIQRAQPPVKDSYYISLTNPDSVICLVDIRFAQMHAAVRLDLWQEAFKAIEEVHNLFLLTSKHVKPKVWNQYYEKQAQVYWMANNRLFHAAALQRLLVLQKDQKKNMTQEEIQRLSSQVLLSTLAVPITPVQNDFGRFLEKDDIAREKVRKLTSLLRLPSPPTRNSLLQDLIRYGILQFVPPNLKQLYQCLEVDFDPLQMCGKVLPILDELPLPAEEPCDGEQDPHVDLTQADKPYNPPLGQYKEALKDVLLVRLIKQVAQVYKSISFARLQELAPFASAETLEKMVVRAARRNNLQVRVDHLSHCLHFGVDLSMNIKEDVPEGPWVQSMPAETVHMQLCMFSQALQQAASLLFAEEASAKLDKERQKVRKMYLKSADEDHRTLLARRKTIEERKEFLESREKAKKRREEEEMKSREQREREAEEERLEREKKERETLQVQRERDEMIRKSKIERLENLTKYSKTARADFAPEDIDNLSADELLNRQLKRLEKERQEKINQQKKQEKKIDYFERAKRLEEIPMLKKEYEVQKETDQQFFEEQEEERISTAIAERKTGVENKKRLDMMSADYGNFMEVLKNRRLEQLEEKMASFEEKLAVMRSEKLEERRKQRIAQRKAEYIEELQEKKKREEERKAEEERIKREEQKRRQEEEMAKLEEVRKKQMEREREIEEKQRKRDQEIADRYRAPESAGEERYLPSGGRRLDKERDTWRDVDQPPDSRRDDDNWGRKDDRDQDRGDPWRRRDDRDRDVWRRRDDRDNRDRGGDAWKRRDDRD